MASLPISRASRRITPRMWSAGIAAPSTCAELRGGLDLLRIGGPLPPLREHQGDAASYERAAHGKCGKLGVEPRVLCILFLLCERPSGVLGCLSSGEDSSTRLPGHLERSLDRLRREGREYVGEDHVVRAG